MIGTAEVKHGLYMLTEPLVSLSQIHTSICNNVAFVLDTNKHCSLWHTRFGHPSLDKLVEINKKFPFVSINKSDAPYDTCFYAKQKSLPFPLNSHVSTHTFDLIHMDKWGSLSIPSMLGYKYFLTIVDDKSRFTWIYLMRLKSEASTLIKSFVFLVQNQFNTKIKTIRTDDGILQQSSCVGTPQQNGIVEHKHQHILAVARALLFQANLPKFFWAHAVSHAIHIINRLPTPFLSNKSPFHLLHDCLPDMKNMRVFGSLCFATTLSAHRKKLDSRSRKCIHIGFKDGVKGYIVFGLHSK